MNKEVPWDLTKFDDLHFSWDRVFGFQRTWNFVIGSRESGKSVNSWVKIFNAYWFKDQPSVVFRRRTVDVSTVYIDDIAKLLNKFLLPQHHIQLCYMSGELKQGCTDIHVGKAGVEYNWQQVKKLPVLFRVASLSCPMSRLKSLFMDNLAYFFFDEFIANTRMKERYLQDEKFIIQELYTTFNREALKPIRIIAAGNPYSVYCPLFSGLNVDTTKLKAGAFVVGPDYVIDCFKVGDELAARIKAKNPMYIADSDYEKYAFNGEAINDANIRQHKCEPKGFKLKWVFRLGNNYLSVHQGRYEDGEGPARYWVCVHKSDWLSKVSKRRKILVFDYSDLMCGAVKLGAAFTLNDFVGLQSAMDSRQILFNSIDASYLTEAVLSGGKV